MLKAVSVAGAALAFSVATLFGPSAGLLPAAADPGESDGGNEPVLCEASALASGGYGSFLIFSKFWHGFGDGSVECPSEVPRTAIALTLELTPAGGDADAKSCGGASCSAGADGKGPQAPINCSIVDVGAAPSGAAFDTYCTEIQIEDPPR